MKRSVSCAHKLKVKDCAECWPKFSGENPNLPDPRVTELEGLLRDHAETIILVHQNGRSEYIGLYIPVSVIQQRIDAFKERRSMSTLTLKARKHYDNYHEDCGSFCTGNGSVTFPYQCPCGTWKYNDDTNQYELEEA